MKSIREASRQIMAAAPLCPVAIGLLAGIALDSNVGPSPWIYATAILLATIAAFSRGWRALTGPMLVAAAASGAGGLLHWSAARVITPTSIERIADRAGTIARLRGVVASEPRLIEKRDDPFARWKFRTDETAFLLNVREIEGANGWLQASGVARVTIREAVFDLREGESVELFGRLMALAPPMNPGAFDWRDYYRRQGVVARVYGDHRENVALLDADHAPSGGWVRLLRRTVAGLLTDDIASAAPVEASLLEAMVLGHRSRFDRKLNDVFTRAGCIHFIAVSGTNVVVLMAAVWFAGRLASLTRRQCAWAMAASVIFYTLLAEPRPPVLRACVMALLFCVALLVRRTTAHLNWLCAAAIILCLIEPNAVFDVGFQLSFAAVFGVAYVAPAMINAYVDGYWWVRCIALRDPFAEADARLRATAARGTPRRWLRDAVGLFTVAVRMLMTTLAVSLAAWACGSPITASYFQQIQPWGAPNSLIVYPLMSVVMILGLVKVAVAALSPSLATVLSSVLSTIDAWMLWVVDRLAALPGATVFVRAPPWWLMASYYLFLVGFAAYYSHQPRRSTLRTGADTHADSTEKALPISRWAWVAPLGVLVLAVAAWSTPTQSAKPLVITALAVGSGSATVLELPNGETILYDAGSLSGSDVGENAVVPFLRHQGIQTLQSIYISHPNLDHFNGIPTVVDNVPTGPVIVNRCFTPLAPFRSAPRRLLRLLAERGHPIEVLDSRTTTWERGGVQFELLWPREGKCAEWEANDTSTVLRLTYAGRSVLLTGDIEETAQQAMMEHGDLRADVLILPHHGAVHSTTRMLLQSVGAGTFVRSSGERTAESDSGMAELTGDSPIYNTADVGAVRIELDPSGVHIVPFLKIKNGE